MTLSNNRSYLIGVLIAGFGYSPTCTHYTTSTAVLQLVQYRNTICRTIGLCSPTYMEYLCRYEGRCYDESTKGMPDEDPYAEATGGAILCDGPFALMTGCKDTPSGNGVQRSWDCWMNSYNASCDSRRLPENCNKL